MIRVTVGPSFDAWRKAARGLLASRVAPEEVDWGTDGELQTSLFGEEPPRPPPSPPSGLRVPPAFLALAGTVWFHRDPGRLSLLYRALVRLTSGEPFLLELLADRDVSALRAMEQAVRRDEHKMHAFVRFRRVPLGDGEAFVAWHRPDHPIVPLAAPFFERRFRAMRWSILTPDASAHWDGEALVYGPGAPRESAPAADELEELFRTYYRSIFNPARINLRAMHAQMPRKHWATLPETTALDAMIRGARARVESMAAAPPSASSAYLPDSGAIGALRDAAARCRACGLCERATQTVFGAGPERARMMLVGEQPGDEEDRAGAPFVGPAGRLLDQTLASVGIDRRALYVTNAVKHFKFEPREGGRIHKTPALAEIDACRAWLSAEVGALSPEVIVCLGATAARSLLGQRVQVTRQRGEIFRTPWAPALLVTYHPAALLRLTDPSRREQARALFASDLASAARLLEGAPSA